MVDEYYNSHYFDLSIDFIIANNFERPSSFFESLYEFWECDGHHHVYHKKEELYRILLQFYRYNNFDREDVFKEVLKFDYLRNRRGNLPDIFDTIILEDFKNRCHKFLQEEENLESHLPKFIGIPAKRIINKTHFETFQYDILGLIDDMSEKPLREETTILFDYEVENKDFGRSRYMKVNI